MSRKPNKSACVIARLLSTEGFTDHLAGEVKHYAKQLATPGQLHRWKRNKRMFAEMVKAKLDDRDKIVMGKLIGALSKMNFDAGLRIGLTAFSHGGFDAADLIGPLERERMALHEALEAVLETYPFVPDPSPEARAARVTAEKRLARGAKK